MTHYPAPPTEGLPDLHRLGARGRPHPPHPPHPPHLRSRNRCL